MTGSRKRNIALTRIALGIAVGYSTLGPATAGSIASGNSDISIRWDNTVGYNLGVRAEKPDRKVLNNSTYDDSDWRFKRGDLVANRLDLVSEFTLAYKKRNGFRISGAAWYDDVYRDGKVETNPAFTVAGIGDTSAAYPGNRLTGFAKRYNRGLSGEFRDAFVFGGIDIGDVPIDVRAGSHNLYWGESFFSFVHGVSYSQGPVDLRSASANPGIEVKDMFLPLTQLSAQAQLTDKLTLAAQYALEWQPSRLSDGGTYLGGVDWLTLGGGTYVTNPAAVVAAGFPPFVRPIPFNGIVNRPDDRGDWGVRLAWNSDWLGAKLGFYYREYTDKLPQIVAGGLQSPIPLPTDIRLSYLQNNKLYGVSLSKNIADVSVGAEVVYRKNTGLLMADTTLEGMSPRGNTWHALVNGLYLLPRTSWFDGGALIGELTYSRLDKVTANPGNFFALGYNCTAQGAPQDKWDGCATRYNIGLAVRFEPTWYQVLPGVDLTAPVFVQTGLRGNSPVLFGGYQQFGSYSLGLTATIRNKYTASLQYNGYLLKAKEGINAFGLPAVTSVNGVGNTSDRGWVSITLKTSF